MKSKGKVGYLAAGLAIVTVAAGVLAASFLNNGTGQELSQEESQRSIAAVEAYMTNKSYNFV